jgi:hypothetical protein
MRTTTCANDAAGNSVKASSNAKAIFFTMTQLLLVSVAWFKFPESCIHSGLLITPTFYHRNSCASRPCFVAVKGENGRPPSIDTAVND